MTTVAVRARPVWRLYLELTKPKVVALIVFTAIVGTLLAVTSISAIADFEGGGLTGFSHAYVAMGVSMLVMLGLAFGLRGKLSAVV